MSSASTLIWSAAPASGTPIAYQVVEDVLYSRRCITALESVPGIASLFTRDGGVADLKAVAPRRWVSGVRRSPARDR